MTKKQSGEYEKKECHTRVNGFYYNSQRGERLRPLDETSLEQLRNSSIENSISYDKLEID